MVMETRSRRRAIADSGSAEHLPESSVTRSSSEETLNLTVMEGDRAAGDVGTSHPEVGDSIRLPGTSSTIQDVSTVEGQGTSPDSGRFSEGRSKSGRGSGPGLFPRPWPRLNPGPMGSAKSYTSLSFVESH